MTCPTDITVIAENTNITVDNNSENIVVLSESSLIEVSPITIDLSLENTVTELQISSDNTTVIEVCKQGPEGIPGSSNTPDSFSEVVASTLTAILDSVSFSNAIALKWFVSIKDSTNDLIKSLEVSAHSNVNGDTTHTVFDVYGDTIPTTIIVSNTSGNIELQITNNHTEGLIVNGTRLTVFQ